MTDDRACPTRYNLGCRCDDCRAAHARKCKAYRARSHGTGTTMVDAAETAAILTELATRMSLSAISRRLGSSHSWVSAVISGRITRIAPERATRVRSVGSYQPDDTSHVSPLGSTRRIQALHAMGYSWARIADNLGGYSATGIKYLLAGKYPVIEARNAKLIRDTYDRLSMQLPIAANPHEQSGITRARKHARDMGWPPPLAWDDIDDPNEKPSLGKQNAGRDDQADENVIMRFLDGERGLRPNHAEKLEITRRWLASGRTQTALEKETGWRVTRYAKGDAA